MNVTFLGTAAANAFPEPFCQCPNCQHARQLGGPSLRRRSALLVDDDLLIDLGPDVLAAANQFGRPLTGVRYCLQTHAHADHLDPSHFFSRSPGYGVVGAPRLNFYASRGTLQRAAELLAPDCGPAGFLTPQTADQLNLTLHPIAAGEAFQAGPYHVTALEANHDPTVEPLLFAIQKAGRCVFYGTDTDALPEATWRAFHHHQLRFDLVILDHTYGVHKQAADHMSADQVIAHAARMRTEGLLTATARVFATHIAHDANPAHPALAAFAAQHGYEVAYDGLTV